LRPEAQRNDRGGGFRNAFELGGFDEFCEFCEFCEYCDSRASNSVTRVDTRSPAS